MTREVSAVSRVEQFRERLESAKLKRMELYVSEEVKSTIREIGVSEEISAGIAAEALLTLGIRAYLLGKGYGRSEADVPTNKEATQDIPADRLATLTNPPLSVYAKRGNLRSRTE